MGGAVWWEKELVSPEPSLICTTDAQEPVNRNQAPVVQKVDNAIHRINLYPLDSAIGFPDILIRWILIYPMDSAIQLLGNRGLDKLSAMDNESRRKYNVHYYVTVQWL